MSRLSGVIDPETRAYVEAITAAVRPGRHLPDGTLAEVADAPSAATTASNSGSRPASAPARWAPIAGTRSP